MVILTGRHMCRFEEDEVREMELEHWETGNKSMIVLDEGYVPQIGAQAVQ